MGVAEFLLFAQPKPRRSLNNRGELKDAFLGDITMTKCRTGCIIVIGLLLLSLLMLVYITTEYDRKREELSPMVETKPRKHHAMPLEFRKPGTNRQTSVDFPAHSKEDVSLPFEPTKVEGMLANPSILHGEDWWQRESPRASKPVLGMEEPESERVGRQEGHYGVEAGQEQVQQQKADASMAAHQDSHLSSKASQGILHSVSGAASPHYIAWGKRPAGRGNKSFQHDWTPRQRRRLGNSKGDKYLGVRLDLNATLMRNAAKALDFELMKGSPHIGRDFDPELKNPCWINNRQKTRCLPAFYILGSFQAGAWTLYSSLAAHPQVLTAGVNARPHFWAEHDKRMEQYVDGYSHSGTITALRATPTSLMGDASASTFAFYWAAGQRLHSAFRKSMGPCWNNCSTYAHSSGSLLQECTDAYCFPKAQEADREAIQAAGISYARSQLPLLMRAVYGKAKPRLVAILRNPVDRFHHAFWSHPHYRDRYGQTAEGFLKYTNESISEFEACEDAYGPLRCVLYFEALGQRQEDVFFHCDQLIRGIYTVFMEFWIGYFGREALHIVHSESYYAEPIPVLQDVSAHIGLLPPEDSSVWQQMAAAGYRARTKDRHVEGAPQMLREARNMLEQFYMPWNHRLAAVLRDRRFHWQS